MLKLTAQLTHSPAQFSANAPYTFIPEHWGAEIVDGLPERLSDASIYGYSLVSADDAVDSLLKELKENDLYGYLVVTRVYAVTEE